MRRVCGGSTADTEAIEVKPVAGHILLGLEHDDMDLRCKHTAQHHKATQADGDTHRGGLDLRRNDGDTGDTVISCQTLMDKSYANVEQSNCC